MFQVLKAVLSGETQVDLTQGSIGKPLLYLSAPVIVTNLLHTAYNVIDLFWLGRHSTEALAAVGFAFPIIFLLISLGIGLSIAGSIMVAQRIGADNPDGAERAASQTMLYISLFSLFVGVLGYMLAEPVVALFGAEPEVIPLAAGYLEIVSLGLILTFGFSVFSSLMRGYGDTVTPMLIMVGSVLINLLIDPFLIFGWSVFPALGVDGAALATVISRGLGFLVGLYILFTGVKGLQISLWKMRPDRDTFRETLRLGGPASFELMARSLSVSAILLIVGMFATPVVAAYGIVTRLYSAVYMPAIAVSRSVETMAGQNIGAGKPDRATRASNLAAKYAFGALTLFGLLCLLIPQQIIGVFAKDPVVLTIGAEFLIILAPTFGFIGIKRSYTGTLRGAGHTLAAAAITIGTLWMFRIPLAYMGAVSLGETGIWYAFAVSNIIGAAFAYQWFRTGRWKPG